MIKNKSNPYISVIMSTYNNEAYLEKAVESILDQSFQDFELIIVDDASTDRTATILDSYDDSRIVRLTNRRNLQLAASLNRGLEIAKGELIARMDSDDISAPERLSKQIVFMAAHPDIDILGTNYYLIDQSSRIIGRSNQPLTHGLIAWHYLSRFAYPLTHATIMARRELFIESDGYNTRYSREQDGELFLRLLSTAKYANLSEHLYFVRASRDANTALKTFSVSYPITLKLRCRSLSQILEREVTLNETKILIFPSQRKHRDIGGVKLTKAEVKQGIQLLFELLQALDRKDYFSTDEKVAAEGELSDLILNMLGNSEEFYLDSSKKQPFRTLLRAVVARILVYLHRPATSVRLVRQKVLKLFTR